jgi:hypothetical protein
MYIGLGLYKYEPAADLESMKVWKYERFGPFCTIALDNSRIDGDIV